MPRVRNNVRERRAGEGAGEDGIGGGCCDKRHEVAVEEEMEGTGGNYSMQQ